MQECIICPFETRGYLKDQFLHLLFAKLFLIRCGEDEWNPVSQIHLKNYSKILKKYNQNLRFADINFPNASKECMQLSSFVNEMGKTATVVLSKKCGLTADKNCPHIM